MISLDIKVLGIGKPKLLSVPSTNMKMKITILMLLLTDTSLIELVRSRRCLVLEMLKHNFSIKWALGVSQKNGFGLVLV